MRQRIQNLGFLEFKTRSMVFGNATQNTKHPLGGPARAFDRVQIEAGRGPSEQVSQGINGPLDQGAERVGPFLQKEVAGIEVRRQAEHAQIQLAPQEKLQGAIGRGLPGFVTVEDQHHLRLSASRRSARR